MRSRWSAMATPPPAAPRPAAWSILRKPRRRSAKPSIAPSGWHRWKLNRWCSRSRPVALHVATPDVTAARNLMLAVERCHLSIEAMVASPYVAGLSVLADDEGDLGAAVVDMGAR